MKNGNVAGAGVQILEQPLHVRLRHGSSLHGDLMSRLTRLATLGESHVRERAEDWTRVDQRLRLYVDLEATARGGDGRPVKSKKKEMPFERSIMIPVSYSTIMSRLAMMFAIATQRDPLIHLEPGEGADVYGARLHEAILKYDLRQSNGHVVLWQLLLDLERYGCCFLYDTWEEEFGWLYEDPIYDPIYHDLLPPHLQHLADDGRYWGMLREWVNWKALAPDRMIIDGAMDLADVQNHRFIGHWDMVPLTHLLANERKDVGLGGPYFNVAAARKFPRELRSGTTGREVQGGYDEFDDVATPIGKLRRLQVMLIPSEWNLGDGDRPERWTFETWNNTVIVRAHRSVYRHQRYTYAVGMADYDSHAPWTAGTGEQVEGTQAVVNYIVAAHIVQLRKAMNDSMVYDPSLLDEERLLRPGQSRHIPLSKLGQRLLHRGFLQIPQMYDQLRYTDTTSAGLQTVQYLTDWVQRLTGANDNIQGQVFPAKRTLGEIEKVSGASTARFGATLNLFERSVLDPGATRAVQNRQQFTSREQVVEIAGELARRFGTDRLTVRPDELTGQYQYIPHTPTMPADPARQSAMWGLIVQSVAGNPQLLAPYEGKRLNPHALLEEWVQSMGVKYFNKFYEDVPGGQTPQMPHARVVPDEEIDRMAGAGNAVPLTREMLHGAA